jgi:SAM-dependent methyltransferase
MNLIAIDQLARDLTCPRCRALIVVNPDACRCSNAACGQVYRVIGGKPILVDFDQSILVEQEVAAGAARSSIQRGEGGLKRRIIRRLLPANRVAAANAVRLVELALALSDRPKLLIIGGGSRGEGTEPLYGDPRLQLISFDIYASDLTQFVGDAHHTPLADASVDAVWIQAVLEHVLDPWLVAAEIRRILKPGGLTYAETPFLQPVHEGAYDFTRFTESGHRWLFRDFEEVDSGVVLGPGDQLLSSIEHAVRGAFRSVTAGVVVKLCLFWLRYIDRLISRAYASDAASAVYFLGRKSGSSIGPKDMVAYYKGAHGRR